MANAVSKWIEPASTKGKAAFMGLLLVACAVTVAASARDSAENKLLQTDRAQVGTLANQASTTVAATEAAERRLAPVAARATRGRRHALMGAAGQTCQTVPSRGAGSGLRQGKPSVTPVVGWLTREWGALSEDGPATGITYGTAPGACVSSPCAGRVVFAARFHSYRRLMIIECSRSCDFVLGGMDRLDAGVGRNVRAGEPVGRMPLAGKAGGGSPLLYVELRKNGQAIDPMPYLTGKP